VDARDGGDTTRLVSPAPQPSAARRTCARRRADAHRRRHDDRAHEDPRARHVLLSTLLGGGMSSRLFQRVREELGLAYAVYTFQSFHADIGMHGVYVGTGPRPRARRSTRSRPSWRSRERGLPDAELAMGKSQLKGQITLSLESVTSRMYRCAGVELYGEPYRTLDEMLALVDAVTSEEIADVARTYFAPERQTVVSLGPGDEF
jgi:predicted Zn-dependent peptidase